MGLWWRWVLVLATLTAGSLPVAACGGEEEGGPTSALSPTPSPRPTATAIPTPRVTPASRGGPERERPPSAVLRAGDAHHTAGPGSFCWEGFCADLFALVVPTEPMAVARGQPLILELGFDPIRVYIAIWRPDQGAVVGQPSDHAFAWRQRGPPEEPVVQETPPVARKIELRPDLPPGTYVVSVSARAAGGDASYGFHVEIVP